MKEEVEGVQAEGKNWGLPEAKLHHETQHQFLLF
jgi:hypothetical protein